MKQDSSTHLESLLGGPRLGFPIIFVMHLPSRSGLKEEKVLSNVECESSNMLELVVNSITLNHIIISAPTKNYTTLNQRFKVYFR